MEQERRTVLNQSNFIRTGAKRAEAPGKLWWEPGKLWRERP
jgi:hypothetical protein